MTEHNNACKIIIKIMQNSVFEPEIHALQNNKLLFISNKLFPLYCVLDCDNIIRVCGRLSHQQSFIFKRKIPMLLLKNHPVTKDKLNWATCRRVSAKPLS